MSGVATQVINFFSAYCMCSYSEFRIVLRAITEYLEFLQEMS